MGACLNRGSGAVRSVDPLACSLEALLEEAQAANPATDTDEMGSKRHQPIGWRSPAIRLVILTVGWALAVGALGTAIYGFVAGVPVLSLAGALIGFAAWAMAKMVPEPVPALRKADRRRRSSVRQYSEHHLPT